MTRLHRLLATAATLGLLGLVAPHTHSSAAPAAAAASPTVHWSDVDPVMAGTATTSSTQLYRFSTVLSGKAVRWNPCQAIHYRIRTLGMPTGAGPVVKAAVARVAKATGITITYDGQSTGNPSSSWLPKTTSGIRPVLIGWSDAAHNDLLRGQPSAVLGVTRTAYFGVVVDGVSLAATKAAVIALDRTNKLPLNGSVSWNTTLLHELGHAMGLDHVRNSGQLMYPVLQRNLYGLQSGDLAGLARLGRSAGCINLGF